MNPVVANLAMGYGLQLLCACDTTRADAAHIYCETVVWCLSFPLQLCWLCLVNKGSCRCKLSCGSSVHCS